MFRLQRQPRSSENSTLRRSIHPKGVLIYGKRTTYRGYYPVFLAILGAVNAFIYTLQMLHLLPTCIGPVAFYQFSLIGAILWGFLTFIWLGVLGALMLVHPQGWLFMVLIAGFDLMYALLMMLGGSSWEAMAPMIIVCSLELIYCFLPGTKKAFGIPQ
jgi:hypothetical protein